MTFNRMVTDTPYFLRNLFAFIDGGGIIKALTVAGGVISHYLFDQPSQVDAATGVAILIALDTATGFTAAFKTRTPRTSAKLSRVLTKVFGYLAVIAVAAVSQKTIRTTIDLPIVDGVLWLIIATEGLSVLENVEKLGVGRFGVLRKLLGTVLEEDAVATAKASVVASQSSETAAKAATASSKTALTAAEEVADHHQSEEPHV